MTTIVYIPMAADLIHPGHLKIIRAGNALGDVVIGLSSDEAIELKKHRPPVMSFADRFEVVKSIKGVSKVITQESPDYRPNLLKLKPQYIVHGDDWSNEAREQVVNTIAAWNGKLIELPYTKSISSTLLRERARKIKK